MTGGTRDPGEPGTGPDDPTGPDEPGRTPPEARDGARDGAQDRAGDDDAAWAAIVANFGERAHLEDPPAEPGDPQRLRRLFEPYGRPEPRGASAADRTDDPAGDLGKAADAPFVPPPAPPVPRTTADRRAAWAGVLGAPALLLVSLLLGVALPPVVALALVAAFVGGFGYLVATMTREPRDPGDDGARL